MSFFKVMSRLGPLVSRIIPVLAPLLLLQGPAAPSFGSAESLLKAFYIVAIISLLLPLLLKVTVRVSGTGPSGKSDSKMQFILEALFLIAGGFVMVAGVQVFHRSMSQAMFYCLLGLITVTAFNERYRNYPGTGLAVGFHFVTSYSQSLMLFLILRVEAFRPGLIFCLSVAAVSSVLLLAERVLILHLLSYREKLEDLPSEDPVEVARRKKKKNKRKRRAAAKQEVEHLTRWQKKLMEGPDLPPDRRMRRAFAVLVAIGPVIAGLMGCVGMLPRSFISLLLLPAIFSRSLIEPLSLADEKSPLPDHFLGRTSAFCISYLAAIGIAGFFS